MILGRVDEVDGNFVATKFIALAVPAECLYVARSGKRTTGSGSPSEGMPIRRSWKSVGLFYGRAWLPAIAIAGLVFDLTHGGPHLLIAFSILVLLGVSALAHRSGRLSEHEKARLRLLGTVTGLRLDPAMLRPSTREVKRASLGELMEKAGIPPNAESIVSLIDQIPVPALPLVYGYARYAGDDPAWLGCAELVFQRHEEGSL